MFFAQNGDRAVLDEFIWPTNTHDRGIDSLGMQMFHDRAAKTIVQNMILDRAEDFNAAPEKFERAGVEWFDPTRIDKGDGSSFPLEFTRGFFGNFKHVA